MIPFIFVAVLLGTFIVFIRSFLCRKKCGQQLPGIKLGLFYVLRDWTTAFKYLALNDGLPAFYHYMQFLKKRTEQLRQQQLFCVWCFYKRYICFIKSEAVK
ncbi:hypothetical protein TNCT_585811, partial [Trichonephila clavata]